MGSKKKRKKIQIKKRKIMNIFIHRITPVKNEITPVKEIRITSSSQDWFDSEIIDEIILRDKCLKFKASRLNNDKQFYKAAKKNVQKLTKRKKRDFYQEKLRESVGRPKELWKALKYQVFCIQDNPSPSNFSERWGKSFLWRKNE